MQQSEIKAKSQEKVNAITTLCKQLQVVITAEQMITDQGLIKQVVYYNDEENYNVDKEPVTTKTDEIKTEDGPALGEANEAKDKPVEAKILEP